MNEAHEDQQLILAAQQDPQAFAVLYEKYIDRMYQFLYFRTGQNPETAEDMTAELFTRAFTQLSRFSWQGYPYSAYLYQVARSLCVDYYRKHAIVVDVDALELQDDRSDTVMTQMDIRIHRQQMHLSRMIMVYITWQEMWLSGAKMRMLIMPLP